MQWAQESRRPLWPFVETYIGTLVQASALIDLKQLEKNSHRSSLTLCPTRPLRW